MKKRTFLHKVFARGLFTLFFFGVFGVVFASDGGTIYTNWILPLFEEVPADFNTPLSNVTVYQAHALSDENQNEVMWAKNEGIAIGQKVFDENLLFRLESNQPTIKLNAVSGNPEFRIGDTMDHSGIYFDNLSDELRVWVGTDSIGKNYLALKKEKVNFPEGVYVGNKKAISGNISCAAEEYIRGIDSSGNLICEKMHSYRWGSGIWSACVNNTQTREVYCENELGQRSDRQYCIDWGEVAPVSTKTCQ